MQIVSPLLFGISASLDALLVGITFGIRGASIKLSQNLIISFITLLGTCLSVGLGARLTMLLPASLWKLSGSLILMLLGIWYITKFMITTVKKCRENTQLTATQKKSALSFAEACSLGCALSANNIGIGLSASITGLSLIPASIVTFFFSLIFLFAGNRMGQCRMIQLTEHTTDIITGLLLVGLGLLQLMN